MDGQRIMRIDLGLLLAIVIEYIVFINYADVLFSRKKSKLFTYSFVALMSLLNLVSCMIGIVWLNILTQLVGHMAAFLVCYHVSIKSAAFQCSILALLMIADELLVVSMPQINIPDSPANFLPLQSLMLTLVSRVLYIVEIMAISRFFAKRQAGRDWFSLANISIVLVSVVALWLVFIFGKELLWIVCILMLVINMIVFVLDLRMVRKEIENSALKEQIKKETIDFEEYSLLLEKYEQTRTFRHDIKEHLGVLNSLIDESPEKAKEYIKKICEGENEVSYSRFSDNKIFNILLSKKKGECEAGGVQLEIDPVEATLGFISDMDTVTLFSNLLNNAYESAKESGEKKICLGITTKNNSFVVVKISNSSDKMPVVINSVLQTTKENERLHGIGISSIKKVIKKYDGMLDWSYDERQKSFSTTVVLKKNI